jgi:hypothetical protein
MVKWILILLLACSASFCACQGNCDQLPQSYSSYREAIAVIRTTHFNLTDKLNTYRSSWIRGADYYSCDGLTGFLIVKTASRTYIYSHVPLDVWKGFKMADSFGSYYDRNIKSRYEFKLTPQ